MLQIWTQIQSRLFAAARRRGGGGAGDWVFGIRRCQLSCTRIYTQYPVISHNVDEDAKVYSNGISSLKSRNWQNVVSSLYVSKTWRKKTGPDSGYWTAPPWSWACSLAGRRWPDQEAGKGRVRGLTDDRVRGTNPAPFLSTHLPSPSTESVCAGVSAPYTSRTMEQTH